MLSFVVGKSGVEHNQLRALACNALAIINNSIRRLLIYHPLRKNHFRKTVGAMPITHSDSAVEGCRFRGPRGSCVIFAQRGQWIAARQK